MTSRKNLVVALLAFFTTSAAYALVADDKAKPTKVKSVETRICELQSERSKLLQKRVELLTAGYEQGDTPLDVLLSAEYDLLKARLQSCAAQSERMELLRTILKNRKRVEDYRAASFDQGTGSEDDLLVARADTLNAQISLLKELPPHASIKSAE